MKQIRIGLDIDDVIAHFTKAVIDYAKLKNIEHNLAYCDDGATCWWTPEDLNVVMEHLWGDPKFWLSIPPLIKEIPFTPNCYITKRSIPSEITEKWIAKHKFPKAPVITVSDPADKLRVVQERNLDIFVDDLHSTVRQMREAGVNALLMKASHQQGHKKECAGLPTIKSLEEVFKYI